MSESEKKKRDPRRVLLPVVAVLVLGFVIKQVFFNRDFLFAGTLEATKVDLSAQVPSTIAEVKIQEGDHVKDGQSLVELACDDIRIASQLANTNYERTLRLFRSGSVSQDAMDQIKSKKQDVDVRMGWCSIRSPIQGTVLNRYHEPAEWVTPGNKLLTLANIQDIWTYIYVPQPEVSRLKPGQEVQGTLPEMNGRAFKGKIVKINEEAEFTPKNVQTRAERTRLVFGVKVSFMGSNVDEVLKPGMTIEIDLPRN